MQLEAGKILEGKVKGITKFGAFVELESGEVGMVHISEVAPTYVNDISEHLSEGQTVTVKVLAVNEDGKISLSIKRAMKPPLKKDFSNHDGAKQQSNSSGRNNQRFDHYSAKSSNFSRNAQNNKPASFEDMLSKFMASSDEKISGMKKNREINRRSGQRRPR